MAYDYPDSPTEGQLYAPTGGPTYQYAGGKWVAISRPAANITYPVTLTAPSYRNRIINGDFVIDQRWGGALQTISAAGTVYAPDRWMGAVAGGMPGQFAMGRTVDSVPLGEFILQTSVTTVDASLAAGDHYLFQHDLEGQMCRGFNWGNAQAKAVTLSFEALTANLGTVTLPVSLRNGAYNRTWLGSFTVPPGVRTSIALTIPGDVTGTWDYGSVMGISVAFTLGAGTTWQGVAGWQTGNLLTLAGMTNVMATINGTLYLRNVQLELGSTATEFERVPYPDQLARCQRYYEIAHCVLGTGGVNNTATNQMAWKVTKRGVPTMAWTYDAGSGATFTVLAGGVNGFYQSSPHSQIATGTVTGSAEI